jgi:hypothetical protein
VNKKKKFVLMRIFKIFVRMEMRMRFFRGFVKSGYSTMESGTSPTFNVAPM